MIGPHDPRHGTLNGYGNFACRCQPCRDANSAYRRSRREVVVVMEPDDPRHGTRNGYDNFGCRCQSCKDANAAAHLAYMHSHPEQQEKSRKRGNAAYRLKRGRT